MVSRLRNSSGTALRFLDGALAMRPDILSSSNCGLEMLIPAGECCARDDAGEREEEAAVRFGLTNCN